MSSLLNPSHLVKDFGYVGIFITLFLESGVVVGFFLPGDSLLFTAGLLASQHYLNLVGVMAVSVIAAILGNNAGFYMGRSLGHTLFTKKGSVWFSPAHVREAHEFFESRGPQALILARFIPAVRTFVPIAAGIGEMAYRQFFRFNAAGALLWGISLPALGYTLGKTVPNIDKYLLPAVAVIILLSILPAAIHYFKIKKK